MSLVFHSEWLVAMFIVYTHMLAYTHARTHTNAAEQAKSDMERCTCMCVCVFALEMSNENCII